MDDFMSAINVVVTADDVTQCAGQFTDADIGITQQYLNEVYSMHILNEPITRASETQLEPADRIVELETRNEELQTLNAPILGRPYTSWG